LQGVSQVAIQSGRHAADTICRTLEGDTTRRPFRYRDFGTMATISRFRALAAIGRVRLAGFPAWVLWLFVHLAALTGFKHRLSVFFNWTVGLLGGGRAASSLSSRCSGGTPWQRKRRLRDPQQHWRDDPPRLRGAVVGVGDEREPAPAE